MSIEYRPAVRENVPLLIGIAGPTGSGKTLSALKMARGLAGGDDSRIFVLDTESERAKHYAPAKGEQPSAAKFGFRHADLRPPFAPQAYRDAVMAAEAAGAAVILVDSTSHVWAGDGGCLDWQEQEVNRMAGDNWAKREAVKMAGWIKPKASHKRMVSAFLCCRAHIIFCLRAEEKLLMKTETDDRGKRTTVIVPAADRPILERWQPICEKNFMYEMTVSLLVLPSAPGVPLPVKLQEQHRSMIPLDKPLSEDAGSALLAWANGGAEPSGRGPSSLALAEAAARKGAEAFRAWWNGDGKLHRTAVRGDMTHLQDLAAKADAGTDEAEEDPFDDPQAREAATSGVRTPDAEREGTDTAGKSSGYGDDVHRAQADHIIKLIKAAGPDVVAVDMVMKENRTISENLRENSPSNYDRLIEASIDRKDVLHQAEDKAA